MKKYLFLLLILIFIKNLNITNKYNNRIYVSLTSFKERINIINKTLDILLSNTIRPKKVILNLAIEEFQNKELDLPENILILLKKYSNFEIFWVEKNNKNFKKLIPTLNRLNLNDLVITVDDDISYPRNLFENMLKCYNEYGRKNPVSFGSKTSDWNISGKIINSHYGRATIVKAKYFNNKINEIYNYTTKKLINKGIKCFDDILYTYSALLNGYSYKRCKEYSIKKFVVKSPKFKISISENNNIKIKKQRLEYHNIIRNYIKKKYKMTIEKLIEKIKN